MCSYNYSIRESPLLRSRDLLRDYVQAMRKGGIGTGIYFQLFYDYWGGYLHGKMQPNGEGAPKLTAEQYFDVTTQQLAEVWDPAMYGNHTELWFDGGLVGWSASAVAKVTALMAGLQPGAVAFQGPTLTQAVRWIGNENGHAAAPNWIASETSMANGLLHLSHEHSSSSIATE
jgi:alpha-L-fucosidase